MHAHVLSHTLAYLSGIAVHKWYEEGYNLLIQVTEISLKSLHTLMVATQIQTCSYGTHGTGNMTTCAEPESITMIILH